MPDPDENTPLHEQFVKVAPFDLLDDAERAALAGAIKRVAIGAGEVIFEEGAPLDSLYVVESGSVEIRTLGDDVVSHRGPGDVMGERGLLREGRAMLTARTIEPTTLLLLEGARFRDLVDRVPEVRRWFRRSVRTEPGEDDGPYAAGLTALQVSDLMARKTGNLLRKPYGNRSGADDAGSGNKLCSRDQGRPAFRHCHRA